MRRDNHGTEKSGATVICIHALYRNDQANFLWLLRLPKYHSNPQRIRPVSDWGRFLRALSAPPQHHEAIYGCTHSVKAGSSTNLRRLAVSQLPDQAATLENVLKVLASPNNAFITIPKWAGCFGSYRTLEGIGRKPKSFVMGSELSSGVSGPFGPTSLAGAGRVAAVDIDWRRVSLPGSAPDMGEEKRGCQGSASGRDTRQHGGTEGEDIERSCSTPLAKVAHPARALRCGMPLPMLAVDGCAAFPDESSSLPNVRNVSIRSRGGPRVYKYRHPSRCAIVGRTPQTSMRYSQGAREKVGQS